MNSNFIVNFLKFCYETRFFFIFLSIFFLYIEFYNENFFSNKRNVNLSILGIGLITSVLLFIFVPFCNRYYTDQSVFLYIGQMMHKGFIPYKDLFDHKGILLYFIQYLGVALAPNSTTGVWFLQLVNITITTYFFYKISKLFVNRDDVSIITSLFVVFFLGSNCYAGGGYTEDWSLSAIACSYYVFLKYFKNNKYKNLDIIIIGICFAIVSFLRVNMVLVWGIYMPLILINFITQKKIKDIIKCTILFVLGITLVSFPIFLYCINNNCIEDFWKDYIQFNLLYTGYGTWKNRFFSIGLAIRNNLLGFLIILIFYFMKSPSKSICMIFVKLLHLIYVLLSLIVVGMSGRGDVNYFIFLLPIYVIPTSFFLFRIINLMEEKGIKELIVYSNVFKYGVFLFIVFIFFVETLNCIRLVRRNSIINETEIIKYINTNTLQTDDILVLGNFCDIYIQTKRYSSNKYFYQLPPLSISKEMQTDFCDILMECKADYIFLLENGPDANYRWAFTTSNKPVIKTLEELVSDGKYTIIDYAGDIIYKKVK